MNPSNSQRTVLALAIRTAVRGAMQELEEVHVVENAGINSDVRVSPNRGLTFLSQEHWQQVIQELNTDLPWHTRRANILLSGAGLGEYIGKSIRVGEVHVEIIGETLPCGLMDEQFTGLMAALAPDVRAGVHGQVVQGGIIRIGDQAEVLQNRS